MKEKTKKEIKSILIIILILFGFAGSVIIGLSKLSDIRDPQQECLGEYAEKYCNENNGTLTTIFEDTIFISLPTSFVCDFKRDTRDIYYNNTRYLFLEEELDECRERKR